MKILITGGTGLVGKEIGKKLAAKDHELFILTRDKEKAYRECPFPQTPIEWSELSKSPLISEIQCIINLAGANINEKRWSSRFKKQIYDSRVQGTRQLVEVANEKCHNLQSFISTSAIGIYGEADDTLADENYNQSYNFLGKLCQDWEAPLSNLQKARSVIFRVGVVFSEKGGAFAEIVPPIQKGLGGAIGNGKQFMSWIDIEDLSNMYVFAAENPLQGVYNATAPKPESNKYISQSIADHLQVRLGPSVPYWALRLVVGEVAPHLIESQKISSEKIQNKGFQFKYREVVDSIQARVPKLKGTEKRLIFEQWVPKKKEEIFPFFSDPKNLEKITPPALNFQILSSSSDPIQTGTEINYKLRINGIPLRWKTRIKDWNPPHMFSDNQEKGPYRKWYHIHRFEDLAGGTLMTDQVDFILPFGILGYSMASWKVLGDIKNIFNYRRKQICKMFY